MVDRDFNKSARTASGRSRVAYGVSASSLTSPGNDLASLLVELFEHDQS